MHQAKKPTKLFTLTSFMMEGMSVLTSEADPPGWKHMIEGMNSVHTHLLHDGGYERLDLGGGAPRLETHLAGSHHLV